MEIMLNFFFANSSWLIPVAILAVLVGSLAYLGFRANRSESGTGGYSRMWQWLVLGVVFYTSALLITQVQLQTLFWKLGHVTIGSYMAYWVYRVLFGRFERSKATQGQYVARAIVVLACIYAVANGL